MESLLITDLGGLLSRHAAAVATATFRLFDFVQALLQGGNNVRVRNP